MADFVISTGGYKDHSTSDHSFVTATVPDPSQQSYDPGSFTVATGKYVIVAKELRLTGTERATVAGTGRLVLI